MTQPAPVTAPEVLARAPRARARRASRALRPRLLAVKYSTFTVVFEVPEGVTTRAEVETLGTPRYVFRGASWEPWKSTGRPSWARTWGTAEALEQVPQAAPDVPRVVAPAAFVVDVSAWCRWPAEVRGDLRLVGGFAKGPGVMATAVLDGATAERVRNLVAARGLVGLEERAP